MKARIQKAAPDKELVLLYRVDQADGNKKLEAILQEVGLSSKTLTEADLKETVGYLAECDGFEKSIPSAPVSWEIGALPTLVMSGVDRKKLDTLLLALRREGIEIPLKAMVTPYNKPWPFAQLLDALVAENQHFTAEEDKA